MASKRQQLWLEAAAAEERKSNDVLAGFFTLLAQPNEQEGTAGRKVPPTVSP